MWDIDQLVELLKALTNLNISFQFKKTNYDTIHI